MREATSLEARQLEPREGPGASMAAGGRVPAMAAAAGVVLASAPIAARRSALQESDAAKAAPL